MSGNANNLGCAGFLFGIGFGMASIAMIVNIHNAQKTDTVALAKAYAAYNGYPGVEARCFSFDSDDLFYETCIFKYPTNEGSVFVVIDCPIEDSVTQICRLKK